MTDTYAARRERMERAIERVKAWMQAHGAAALVENLESGALPERLDACETEVGFPLTPDLRALWSIHAGQKLELDGFVGAMDLLGPEGAAGDSEQVTLSVASLRKDPATWDEAGVTKAEMESDAWVSFAGRGYADLLVVSAATGSVFYCGKDSPPLRFVALSILDWLEAYADRVEAGAYAVEEGFGQCYLARDTAMY